MANTYTASLSKIVGILDSTGATDSIKVNGARLVDLSLDFSEGTFDGTVQLQRRSNTGTSSALAWRTIATYTTSTEITFRSATTREYRLNVSVATSGSLYFEMTAGNKEGN